MLAPQRLPHDSHDRVGIKFFLVAGLLFSALMLVIGSLGGAVAFATGTGFIWLAWRFGAGMHQQSQ
jgi:hypothetical protein